MVSYLPFWRTAASKNISTYTLIQKYGIAPSTIQRLRDFEYVSVRTLDELCQILDCQIGELVEILPDDSQDISTLKQLAHQIRLKANK